MDLYTCKECYANPGCSWHMANSLHGEFCANYCLMDGTCFDDPGSNMDGECPLPGTLWSSNRLHNFAVYSFFASFKQN